MKHYFKSERLNELTEILSSQSIISSWVFFFVFSALSYSIIYYIILQHTLFLEFLRISEFFLYVMITSEKRPKTLSEFLDLKGDEQKQGFEKKSIQRCKPELQVNLNILIMLIYFIELLLSYNGLVCPQPGIIASVVNGIFLTSTLIPQQVPLVLVKKCHYGFLSPYIAYCAKLSAQNNSTLQWLLFLHDLRFSSRL